MCSPLTIDISCDERRFLDAGASRSRLECTRQRPTQHSRTSMIAHKKIRIKYKNQRRRGASPFVHEVYFKLSRADSEQAIVQGHSPTALDHRRERLEFGWSTGQNLENPKITVNCYIEAAPAAPRSAKHFPFSATSIFQSMERQFNSKKSFAITKGTK